MTGRQKIESAFSKEGTNEFPAVICYEGIYIRDHWEELTDCPWWYQYSPDIDQQMQWYHDFITKTGQDWFVLPYFYSESERNNKYIEINSYGVFMNDKQTGSRYELRRPKISGWSESGKLHSVHPSRLIDTYDEIDQAIYISTEFDPYRIIKNGNNFLADRLLSEFELFPICHVSSPLWNTYGIWGFEGMMTMIATKPDIVKYACERYLESSIRSVKCSAVLGAKGIWIEECMTDMISPQAFKELNVPFLKRLVEEIRNAGMKSIYYYCGDLAGKWEHILSVGADAISLEESKKGFVIDINDVVEIINGQSVVLGNLDAINLLPNCTEEQLRAEILRQLEAGKRNKRRFIMSIGSPVTPNTSVEKVKLYCDLVHELGKFQ